jgi:hypothetical protein
VRLLALLGIASGAVAFGVGLRVSPAATWRGLFVNFLFWISLAQGAVMWAVAFRLARTSWSAPLNRMGHAFASFLPFGVIVFAVLFLGRESLLPWLHLPVGDRRWWLNAPSMWARDGAALILLATLSWVYVRTSLRADGAHSAEEAGRANHRLSVVGVALLFAYGWLYTLLGFDLVQSLVPGWHSALLGWYFAMGGMYLGIAALIVTAVATRRWLGVSDRVGPNQFLDLGNLLLACAMIMTYFLYSQALPIWYENLPPETSFALPRLQYQPWETLCVVLLFTCFLGVFALLLLREMKQRPATLLGVALLALAGMGLERYLLVMPSLAPRHPAFPYLGVLMAAGFLGVLVLAVASFLARHPALSPLDLALEGEHDRWP